MTEGKKHKVIAVIGPTASGKSGLAIKLAKEFNGEIINADSRQIYKFMNIGTAKDPDDDPNDEFYTVEDVRHHLIDFVEPDRVFSVAEFQKLAWQKIEEIESRGKIPFLVGGTGLWIDAVCNPSYVFNEDQADWSLRKELETKNIDELFEILWDAKPEVAVNLNRSDTNNPVRLIRLIEKNRFATDTTPSSRTRFPFIKGEMSRSDNGDLIGISTNYKSQTISYLYLSPKISFEQLEQRIYTRVDKMIEQGLIEEVKSLLEKGFDFKTPGMSGIGYKEFEGFFPSPPDKGGCSEGTGGLKTIETVAKEIKLRTRQYAKRQITWFKRNKNIKYVDLEEAKTAVTGFLNKS